MRNYFKEMTKATKWILFVLLGFLVLGKIASASISQNGSDVKFTKQYVKQYSDRDGYTDYSLISVGKKRNEGKTLYVTVTHMYDKNGNNKDNDWTYTRWRVDKAYNGRKIEMAHNVKLKRTVYTGISLNSKVMNNEFLYVSARGNSSKYTAQISGYIHNFNLYS